MIASNSDEDCSEYAGENAAPGGIDDIVVSPTAIEIALSPVRSQPPKAGKTCGKGIFAW